MAAFDFPTSPTNGQLYALNGRTYQYNAAKQRWDGFTVNGAQGIQGITGEQGIQGISGNQGVQGIQGTGGAGEQGVQGITGSQGIQGIAGSIASQGVQGIQGIEGAGGQGVQGTTGSQGIQGIAGAVASQGVQGIQGTSGAGSQGVQGITGSQGTQGTGAQGIQGITGSQGITGVSGANTVPAAGTKTSSYTLAAGDVGDFVAIGSGGSIVIPSGVFSTGDIISIFNNTSSNATITSSAVTSYISGADTDVSSITLFTRGLCTILFVGTNICVVSGAVS
jgi:hypothetical protein